LFSAELPQSDQIGKKTIAITPATGVTLDRVNCYSLNGVVCVAFRAHGKAFVAGDTVATISSEYKPSVIIPGFAINNADDSFRAIYVQTDGRITISGSASDIRLSVVYAI
jgi:hypothetical protein